MDSTLLFKALSDITRLRCLTLLVNADELCVCELTQAMSIAQPKVSHHLAALRKAGLVTDRKEGLWIHYRINETLPQWVYEVMQAAARGMSHAEPFVTDAAALAEMRNSAKNVCG
jgi:ArsR family transcriptional regulator